MSGLILKSFTEEETKRQVGHENGIRSSFLIASFTTPGGWDRSSVSVTYASSVVKGGKS